MTNNVPRQKNVYDPESKEPFRLSRTRIDMFMECPRCFYLDRRLGIDRPSIPGFSLNNAVDHLLKNEFDLLRKNGEAHALMDKYKIDAVLFDHPDLSVWRDDCCKRIGACVLHKKTNLEISGIIDDIWINKKKELLIVDYKATSTSKEISLEDKYKQAYKRQMEIYQWIFRQLGFKVNNTGYFVFANASKNRPNFDGRLEFELSIVPYIGNDDWIDDAIVNIKKCLDSDKIPPQNPDCEHCNYRELANKKIRTELI